MNSSLEQMQHIDIRTIDPDVLVDVRNVSVNTSLPREQRMQDYLEQIKNPYCFKCGKTVVKVSFSDTDATLEDKLKKYLLTL